jgi:hypothetical protein
MQTEYEKRAMDLKQFAIAFINCFELGKANVKLCFILKKKIQMVVTFTAARDQEC